MPVTTAVAWTIAFAVLLFALFRRVQEPVFEPISVADAVPALPDDDDEQKPETDRAPGHFPWLAASVAATAALRVGLLAVLHH
jgi:hypothetical protein